MILRSITDILSDCKPRDRCLELFGIPKQYADASVYRVATGDGVPTPPRVLAELVEQIGHENDILHSSQTSFEDFTRSYGMGEFRGEVVFQEARSDGNFQDINDSTRSEFEEVPVSSFDPLDTPETTYSDFVEIV